MYVSFETIEEAAKTKSELEKIGKGNPISYRNTSNIKVEFSIYDDPSLKDNQPRFLTKQVFVKDTQHVVVSGLIVITDFIDHEEEKSLISFVSLFNSYSFFFVLFLKN